MTCIFKHDQIILEAYSKVSINYLFKGDRNKFADRRCLQKYCHGDLVNISV